MIGGITSAAVATIIALITSTVVTLFLKKSNRRQILDQQLFDLRKMALQYPYLESKLFTNKWNSGYDLSDERSLRYEIYATLVFNFLSDFTRFYHYNTKKVEIELAIKNWINTHKKYWYDPTLPNENVDVYDEPFKKLVEGYLAG